MKTPLVEDNDTRRPCRFQRAAGALGEACLPVHANRTHMGLIPDPMRYGFAVTLQTILAPTQDIDSVVLCVTRKKHYGCFSINGDSLKRRTSQTYYYIQSGYLLLYPNGNGRQRA